MAKVVVIEPQDEVRELLLRVVARLGHEPLSYEGENDLLEAEILLLEPAAAEGLRAARGARARGAAIVCLSIFPPSDETRALEPAAYLQKPFSIVDLEHALVGALASRSPLTAA